MLVPGGGRRDGENKGRSTIAEKLVSGGNAARAGAGALVGAAASGRIAGTGGKSHGQMAATVHIAAVAPSR